MQVFAFFDVLGKARKEILDDVGCKMGCSVMSDAQEFILGKKEAVYFYGTEGRGACLAFEGDKKFLAWFRSYLIVIGQETNNSKVEFSFDSHDSSLHSLIVRLNNESLTVQVEMLMSDSSTRSKCTTSRIDSSPVASNTNFRTSRTSSLNGDPYSS